MSNKTNTHKTKAALKGPDLSFLKKKETILNAVEDLVFEIDKKGNFVFYHAPDEAKLYADPKFFMEKNYSEVLPPHISKRIRRGIAQNRRGDTANFSYSLNIGDAIMYFSAKMSPIVHKGVYQSSVAVVRDVTEQKEGEKKIEHLKKMLEVISSVNQILIKEVDEEKLLQKVVDAIHSSSECGCVFLALVDKDALPTNYFTATHHACTKGYLDHIHSKKYIQTLKKKESVCYS